MSLSKDERECMITKFIEIYGLTRSEAEFAVSVELDEIEGDVRCAESDVDGVKN